MREFRKYDEMMSEYYEKLAYVPTPLISWDIYSEHYDYLTSFRNDLSDLQELSKSWSFNADYINEFMVKRSVILVTDTNLKIVYASHNIKQLNGYNTEEVIGKSPKMFQGIGTDTFTSQKIRRAVQEEKPFEETILNYRKDHSTYKCVIKGFPVRDKKGKVVNYIAFEKAA